MTTTTTISATVLTAETPPEDRDGVILALLVMRLQVLERQMASIGALRSAIAQCMYGGLNPDSPQVWARIFEAVYANDEANEIEEVAIAGPRCHLKAGWFGYSQDSAQLLLGNETWRG